LGNKENVSHAVVLPLVEIKSEIALEPIADALKDESFEVGMNAKIPLKIFAGYNSLVKFRINFTNLNKTNHFDLQYQYELYDKR